MHIIANMALQTIEIPNKGEITMAGNILLIGTAFAALTISKYL